jgi:hypothetical protein
MARTLNFISFYLPVLQGTAIMRADVGNTIETAVYVKKHDGLFFKFQPQAFARGEIVDSSNFYKFRH